MSAPESPEFSKALVEVKQLTKKPNNDELLRLYGTRRPFSSWKQ